MYFLVLIVILLVRDSQAADPCIWYRTIDDVTRQPSQGYDTACDQDKFPSGWYRFKLNGADAQMPTSCVPRYHCGTDVPMWLNLSVPLPGVGTEVDAVACGSAGPGDCCVPGYSVNTTVRNCGGFLVYRLRHTPFCNHRYCAELLTTPLPTVRPSTQDPCTGYRTIDDVTRQPSQGRDLSCDDSLTPGWYRFKLNGADAQMPTSCVPYYHCGTFTPMWLNLSVPLPAVGKEVDAVACANAGYDDCCLSVYSVNATVRNCGGFLVYRLGPTPSCFSRYCAESSTTNPTSTTEATTPVTASTTPDMTYTCHQHLCYEFVDRPSAWQVANSTCAAMGAQLVEPRDPGANAFVKGVTVSRHAHAVWIGAADLVTEGVWQWAGTGSRMSDYTDWAPGQPNNLQGQDCAVMLKTLDFQWDDESCQKELPFICQRAGPDDVVVG